MFGFYILAVLNIIFYVVAAPPPVAYLKNPWDRSSRSNLRLSLDKKLLLKNMTRPTTEQP